MKLGKSLPPMPPNPAPHIVDRLMEMGFIVTTGGAPSPIGMLEIDAWCRRTHIDLPPFESRLLARLSKAYLAESVRAESETAPPPWHAPVTRRDIELEEERLRMVLG
ncbi:hypothetical protein GG804_26090 [Sphingomonas histidinilytica]|uniref:hypothetical protein n=1 Tax=Rhizorhabdus histidinilytica TaxID=439228 RepID=UPI000F7775AA|nr:hypothetical protein [Rhizorhabdus histidinilytica]MBO9380240.1 hypothetical protein [Rhizorhabdus histidinilytica]QEH82008.1 hypothetical protein EIK56_25150 [Sphingomonas sp. C8-2]